MGLFGKQRFAVVRTKSTTHSSRTALLIAAMAYRAHSTAENREELMVATEQYVGRPRSEWSQADRELIDAATDIG